MTDRFIYADLLRKDLDKTIEHIAKKQGGTEEGSFAIGSFAIGMCLAFKTMIDEQPAIEAKPVVHAHWENWGCEGTVCSNCHGRVLYECDEHEEKSKSCPHCGAQMDEEAEKDGGDEK